MGSTTTYLHRAASSSLLGPPQVFLFFFLKRSDLFPGYTSRLLSLLMWPGVSGKNGRGKERQVRVNADSTPKDCEREAYAFRHIQESEETSVRTRLRTAQHSTAQHTLLDFCH